MRVSTCVHALIEVCVCVCVCVCARACVRAYNASRFDHRGARGGASGDDPRLLRCRRSRRRTGLVARVAAHTQGLIRAIAAVAHAVAHARGEDVRGRVPNVLAVEERPRARGCFGLIIPTGTITKVVVHPVDDSTRCALEAHHSLTHSLTHSRNHTCINTGMNTHYTRAQNTHSNTHTHTHTHTQNTQHTHTHNTQHAHECTYVRTHKHSHTTHQNQHTKVCNTNTCAHVCTHMHIHTHSRICQLHATLTHAHRHANKLPGRY